MIICKKKQIGTLERLTIYRVYSGKYTFGHYLNKKDAEYVRAYNSRGENPIDCKYGIEEIEVVQDLKINKDNLNYGMCGIEKTPVRDKQG